MKLFSLLFSYLHHGRGGGKNKSLRRWVDLRKHCLLNRAGLLLVGTHRSCDGVPKTYASPSHPKSQHGEGTWTRNPTLSCGAINSCCHLKDRSQFSLLVELGKSNTLQWSVTGPLFGKNKLALISVRTKLVCEKWGQIYKVLQRRVNMTKTCCAKELVLFKFPARRS